MPAQIPLAFEGPLIQQAERCFFLAERAYRQVFRAVLTLV